MQKLFLLIASISGAISVAIGAFGAHSLRNMLQTSGRLDTFETAVKYQFYHTLALFLTGLLLLHTYNKFINWAGYSFIVGTLIFSGSLYILCLTNVSKWGAVTPIGGLFLLIGWALLAYGITQSIKN